MTAAPPLTCDQVNALAREAFVAAFGDVAEHSPWVAEAAAEARPYAGREALIAAFQSAIGTAPEERRRRRVRSSGGGRRRGGSRTFWAGPGGRAGRRVRSAPCR